MEEILKELKSLHDDLKENRPRKKKIDHGAGYRNGFEDGYKFVTKSINDYIEKLESKNK